MGVSCRILYFVVVYLYVLRSGPITSVGEERERELICLMSFTCNCVVSVRGGFLFLWMLGMGHVILLSQWHSLNLSYNYYSYYKPLADNDATPGHDKFGPLEHGKQDL